MAVSEGLFDILQKYNWQIVNNNFIEVISNDREDAWKDIIILSLKTTPKNYRSNIRKGMLEHFDYKQPIYYDLKKRQLNLTNDSIIKALTPPQHTAADTGLVKPVNVVTVFILAVLSYITWKGVRSEEFI
ncbi:ORF104 [Agrotis segetum granulovirus]|uniref:ORF104 n=1 Tax=Agrotis segetum granulosis virus TaxID=10464 RepID=Q6QXG4_GVAS|nr:hypothetical protein AsGV118 [Agrotis segetum granulovirus]AAS82634.1 ORF104 [Agrotis segetum granulovirus]AHN92154.1 hypothetical protein AsGV115 [Agrotis segetum granulovirus]AKN63391.1 hypothetical protein AsGV118 [Agrotis segetum granulovirus]